MRFVPLTLPIVSRILVGLGWAGFFAFFFVKKQPSGPKQAETRREPASKFGIVLQMIAFAVVWMVQRRLSPAGSRLSSAEIALDLFAPVLSAVSAWLGISAVRTLGKQWSYAPRLVR